jgi:hypothetical protein
MMNGVSEQVQIKDITPVWQSALITVDIVLAGLAVLCLIFFIRTRKKNKKEIA